MTTKRPSLTPPTLARRRWVRALRIVAVSSAASAAMACSLLFPFDDLSPPRAPDGAAADRPDVDAVVVYPLADADIPPPLDATVRDASLPDAPTCPCPTGFCTLDGVCDYAVFVTTRVVAGDIRPGGGAAADAICASEATANGIAGTFKAWVSDFTSAAQRVMPTTPRPYRRLDGVPVALDHVELTSGGLRAPINVASNRTPISYYAWTGSNEKGDTYPANNCRGFTSQAGQGVIGKTSEMDYRWSLGGFVDCIASVHLYCIQVAPP